MYSTVVCERKVEVGVVVLSEIGHGLAEVFEVYCRAEFFKRRLERPVEAFIVFRLIGMPSADPHPGPESFPQSA